MNDGDGVMRVVNTDEAALRIIVKQQRSEIDRLRSHIELLEASGAASHSAIMVLDSTVKNMSAEIERLRLTDAEREAVEAVIGAMHQCDASERLRGLLKRTAL